MKEKTAFFAVARKYLNDELWLSEPFTKGQAWVDLIGRASYEDGELTKRGELLISERGLAKRWKWPPSKVRRFLQYLEKEGMIMRSSNRSTNRSTWGSTLRIEKYEDYQNPRSSERSSNRSSKRSLYNNRDNIDNISLNMPDGMTEKLHDLFGSEADDLIAAVRSYYTENPDKSFPGWIEAVSKFKANWKRWEKSAPKKQQAPFERVFARMNQEEDEV